MLLCLVLSNIIDLTHELKSAMPVYPGTPNAEFMEVCTHSIDGFSEISMKISTHTGTHIDAPAHIIKKSLTLSELDPSNFIGKGLIINCSKVGVNLIAELENKFLRFGMPEFILINTGWNKFWGTREYFMEFPIPDRATIEFMSKLSIKGVGIDAISIDPINDEVFTNHKLILGAKKIIIENLTNLEKLSDRMFNFYCFPLKIQNGDGSPVRAVAQID